MRKMKKVLLLFLPIFISCSHVPEKPKMYTIKIYRDDYNAQTKKYIPKVFEHIIKCENDTIAYNKGYIEYYVGVSGEKQIDFPLWKTKSFIVQDASGANVKLKLPQKVVDSIESLVQRLSHEL